MSLVPFLSAAAGPVSEGEGGPSVPSEKEELCAYCSLLNFHQIFLTDEQYTPPPTPANPGNLWHDCICWFSSKVRQEKRCPFCRLLLQTLQITDASAASKGAVIIASVSGWNNSDDDLTLPGCRVLNIGMSEGDELRESSSGDYDHCIGVLGSHKLILPASEVALRDQSHGHEYTVSIRRLNPYRVDTDLIVRWLRTCEYEHTTWCSNPASIPETSNFRVIDVKLGCIVADPAQCRYLTLSYVWGDVYRNKNHTHLTRGNRAELEEEGGLFQHMATLPDSVKDAILLCQNIDERYLWVDSLCIIQDSPVDKQALISQMDIIYSSSVMTIVAAAGSDASAGLPGINSNLKQKIPPVGRVGSLDLVAFQRHGELDVNTSKWNGRSWTFQEKLLSRRLLRFTNTSVTFECLEACFREDLEIAGPKNDHFRLVSNERQEQEMRQNFHQIVSDPELVFEKMASDAKFKNVFGGIFERSYAVVVQDFTKRRLSFQNDMLNAFNGIQAALSRSLGPFYCGCPRRMLAPALAWHVTTGSIVPREGFPSWSWAGWIFADQNHAYYPSHLDGPYPDAFLLLDDGKLSVSPVAPRDLQYMGIWKWHDSMLYPADDKTAGRWAEMRSAKLEDLRQRPTTAPLSQLLWLWTTATPVEQGRIHKEWDWNTLLEGSSLVRKKDEGLVTNGKLTDEELQSILHELESYELDLIYLGLSPLHLGDFCLILVSWVAGIARRTHPELLFLISAESWRAAKPKSKLVILA